MEDWKRKLEEDFGYKSENRVLSFDWDKVSKMKYFDSLESVPLSPEWHKEGNALEHTKNVCGVMSQILSKKYAAFPQYEIPMMLVALFHDVGKVECPIVDGKCKSGGHAVKSESIFREMFFGMPFRMRELICYLIRLHDIRYEQLHMQNERAARLARQIRHDSLTGRFGSEYSIENMLEIISVADSKGSVNDKNYDALEDISEFFSFANYNTKPDAYILCGLPGSGKSTYIRYVGAENETVSLEETARERHVWKEGSPLDATDEFCSMLAVERDFQRRCLLGENVYVDAYNLKHRDRERFVRYARQCGYKTHILYFERGIDDMRSCRRGDEWNSAFTAKLRTLDIPKEDEADEVVFMNELCGECSALWMDGDDGKSFKDPYGIPNVNFTEIDTEDDRWNYFRLQREAQGFDDSETWGLDHTIALFVLPRLKRFKEIETTAFPPQDNEGWEEWNAILEKMIEGFECYSNDREHDDNSKVKEAWKLLGEHFYKLWW